MTIQSGILIAPALADAVYEKPSRLGYDCNDQYNYGNNAGLSLGKTQGYGAGFQAGEEYKSDQLTDYEEGFVAGKGAGGSGVIIDTTDPVVTDISVPTTPSEPWIVHVYDGTGLALVQLSCKDSDIRLTIYDPLDGGFVHPFNGKSTVTGSGTSADPYIFTVYRRGGWPTGVDFSLVARAIDGGGNETDG